MVLKIHGKANGKPLKWDGRNDAIRNLLKNELESEVFAWCVYAVASPHCCKEFKEVAWTREIVAFLSNLLVRSQLNQGHRDR